MTYRTPVDLRSPKLFFESGHVPPLFRNFECPGWLFWTVFIVMALLAMTFIK